MTGTTVRRATGVVTALAGLALLTVALLAAIRLGPQGRWAVRTGPVAASALLVGPGTLQRVAGPVEVHVDAPGPVRVLQGPAADVEALVAGTDAARVVDTDGLPRDLTVAPGRGTPVAAFADDVATAVARGDHGATLTVPHDVRRAVVVTGASGGPLRDAVVTLVHVHRPWFAAALATAAVGLLLTAAGLWLVAGRARGAAPRRVRVHR